MMSLRYATVMLRKKFSPMRFRSVRESIIQAEFSMFCSDRTIHEKRVLKYRGQRCRYSFLRDFETAQSNRNNVDEQRVV